MNLKELNEKLDQINLEKDTKNALLDVINEKISSDMEKVINAIGVLKAETNTAIGSLNSKLESSIGSLNSKIDASNSKIDASNSKIDNMKWFIGAVVAIAVGLAKIFKMF